MTTEAAHLANSLARLDRQQHEDRLATLAQEIQDRVEAAKEAALRDPSIVAETHDIVDAILRWRDEAVMG